MHWQALNTTNRAEEDKENDFILEALQREKMLLAKDVLAKVFDAYDRGNIELCRRQILRLHELKVDVETLLEGKSVLFRVYLKQRLDDLSRLEKLKVAVTSPRSNHHARLERLRAQVSQ